MGFAGVSAENKATTTIPQVRSVFVVPASNKDGRDPFFPDSTRAFEARAAADKKIEYTSLKIHGISKTDGHLLAIINNHTFAVGEEGDVLTPTGKVNLRCLEIRPDFVLVEINGQPHRINLEEQ